MFKLKKILNKSNNAPEVEEMTLMNDVIGKKENIYFVNFGELSPFDDESELGHTLYVIYSDVDELDYQNRKVKCIRITPDMIFEVELNDNYARFGDRFVIYAKNNMQGYESIQLCQSQDEKSDGYIVDVSDLRTKGTVLVRFHCIQ